MRQLTALIDQDDYCDESELVMCQYAHFPSSYFQAEIEYTQKWLINDTSTPLIIAGNMQSGKKSLICSFLRENKDNHSEWLHIVHFGSATPVYSHILYKIMVELRTHFKIEQRVQLNEQKLRRYFKYWLQVVSDLIEKQFLGYSRQQVPKVVIVIEGVDECIDLKGNVVQPQFWLPSQIPKNVKLIISTKDSGEGLIGGATIFRHHFSKEKRRKIIEGYHGRVASLHKVNDELSLNELQIVNRMIKVKPSFEFVSTNFKDIISEYIKSSQSIGLTSDQIKSLLYILSLTGKGLKIKWIQKIVNFTHDKWSLFLKYFAFVIVQQQNYFIICNKASRRTICQLTDPTGEKIRTYRQAIAHSIRTQSMHLRGLEQSVYQLLLSESLLELKEVISRIDNFILLYNPLSKDLLCQCWVKLQQLQQYDPVFEYNRAIETFTSHYYPKEEDLYRIIFQLCMFFKEYSEFQNAKTPQFRHPLIRGEIDQLQDMGMYEELKNMAMVGKSKSYKLKPLQKMSGAKVKKEILKKEIRKTKEIVERESIKKRSSGDVKIEETHFKHKESEINKNEIELSPQMSRPTTSQLDNLVLAEPVAHIEQLNVSIVTNQQKFKRFFANSMKEYLDNYFQPMKKIFTKGKQLSFQSDDSDNDEESFKDKAERQFKFDVEKYKQSLILKQFKEYLEQNYHKSGEEVSCYYYKQWLWLQFPWLCQTVKHIYSNMIRQCLPGSIHFMSPLREFTFIREVIRITKNAKENRMGIFTEKRIEILPLKYSAAKQQITRSKCTRSGNLLNSVGCTKRTTLDDDRSLKVALSISMLEDEINKEKQYYEEHFRLKYGQESRTLKNQNSMPNLNLFVTQHQKQSRMLPLLNKSKFCSETTARKTQKENVKDSRDYTMIIRRYNEIKHENDMLVIKIEEMKKITLMQVDKSKEERVQLSNRTKELQCKKANLQRNFNAQQQLQKKLQVIIKVCDLNKIYGSESDYLSTYLGSLKEMILLEERKVKDIKQKIALSVQNSKVIIRDLRTKRKTLKVCQQNAVFTNEDGMHQNGIAIPLEQIQQQLKEQIRVTRVKSKNIKSKKQIGPSAQDYHILQGQLGIIFGSADNQQKISDLANVMDKQRQLKVKNIELGQDYQQRKRRLECLRSELTVLKEGKANEKTLKTSCDLIERKRQLQQLRQRNQLLCHAIDTLEKFKND